MSWLSDVGDWIAEKGSDLINVLAGKPTTAQLQANIESQRALLASYESTIADLGSAYKSSIASNDNLKKYLLYGVLGIGAIYLMGTLSKGGFR